MQVIVNNYRIAYLLVAAMMPKAKPVLIDKLK
jgi:hypothetical protein